MEDFAIAVLFGVIKVTDKVLVTFGRRGIIIR